MKRSSLLAVLFLAIGLNAQQKPVTDSQNGMLSVGQRTTLSAFNGNDNERNALGLGGQFRIRLSDRINTEWFFDYLPATNTLTRREDYHIGWSVMYYLRDKKTPFFQPYAIAGHCFDYTHHVDLSNSANQIQRWSSAVQAGIGAHLNLTPRLDISFSSQYMIHLGTDVHTLYTGNTVQFEQEKGGALEGHLLMTVSLNFKIVKLWGGK
jgi:opacity protein-like surface antigen